MKKNSLSVLFLTLVTGIILFFLFKPVFQYPNGVLFSKTIDPIKSYFNFGYYLKYGSGIKHHGINYPYGDHLQYINSHPLYAGILKFVDKHIYPIANYGVAILNLSMIFSFLVGIPFLFLILRRFKLPIWYSIIVALILGFLNPQFDRIHGHFEMVYWFFIPMFWYFLIRLREKENQLLWGTLLVISGLISGFISAYFVAFYAIFIFAVIIAELWLSQKKIKESIRPAIKLFILALIPILVVKGFVYMTDWANDRPDNPYGFYVYHASFQSIFFPTKYLWGSLINPDFQWEGRAYVGFPAALLAIAIILLFPIYWIRKKKAPISPFRLENFKVYLLAGVLVLLFSMCFPFKWGLGSLLDILPPVRQFRALGRFSWIFFYIFTIYAAYFFYEGYHTLFNKNKKVIATLVLISVLAIWSYDAILNTQTSTRGLFKKNDKLETSDEIFLERFKSPENSIEQFQAILSLPFASTCGDKLLFESKTPALVEAMKCSYLTGIPLIQSYSPRLPFSQALSSIQMLADSAIRKTRLDDMNEKPLLLITSNNELTNREKELVSKSLTFWDGKYISMYKLPVSVFKNSHENWLKSVQKIKPSLICNNGICTDTTQASIFYDDFSGHESEFSFCKKGAINQRRGEIEIFNGQMPVNSGIVELSFWLYFDTRKYDMPQPIVNTFNQNGELVKSEKLNNRKVHDVFEKWVRIRTKIQVNPEYTYQLTVKGKYITVDDLLIKPEKTNVLISNKGQFDLFNNFPIN